jgi:hypothetical protein
VIKGIWVEWSVVAFGRRWRRGWEIERVECTRVLLSMIVCWQLGVRRTKFTIKAFEGDVPGVANGAGLGAPLVLAEKQAEGKEKAIDPDDDEMDPSIERGEVAAKRIINRWRWLLVEMAGVVLGTVGLPVAGGLLWYKYNL